MSHLKNKRSTSTGFRQLGRAWGGNRNQWMLCFDIYPTVHMPSARISGRSVTPRSPSPGNLRISQSQETFESTMSTQTGYSEWTTNPFLHFPGVQGLLHTCTTILLHTCGKSGDPWSYQTYSLKASTTHTDLQDTSYFTPSENTAVPLLPVPRKAFQTQLQMETSLPAPPGYNKGKRKVKTDNVRLTP